MRPLCAALNVHAYPAIRLFEGFTLTLWISSNGGEAAGVKMKEYRHFATWPRYVLTPKAQARFSGTRSIKQIAMVS